MASPLDLLKSLTDHHVDFVLIGGMAATVHGGSIVTEDVDVCTHFAKENVGRILAALAQLNPRQRMTPDPPALSTRPQPTSVGATCTLSPTLANSTSWAR